MSTTAIRALLRAHYASASRRPTLQGRRSYKCICEDRPNLLVSLENNKLSNFKTVRVRVLVPLSNQMYNRPFRNDGKSVQL